MLLLINFIFIIRTNDNFVEKLRINEKLMKII